MSEAVAQLETTLRLLADLKKRGPGQLPSTLVGVEAVATYLNVSRDFVYGHAAELGGRKLGTGPKAPWRFSLLELDERLKAHASCSIGRGSEERKTPVGMPKRRPRRRRQMGTKAPLLPARGEIGAP